LYFKVWRQDFWAIFNTMCVNGSEQLVRHALFLNEDRQTMFLWIGRDAAPQLVMDGFDLPSYDQAGATSAKHLALSLKCLYFVVQCNA
jgi:hypothetical protein